MNDYAELPQRRYNYLALGLFGLALAGAGWGGLVYLVLNVYPNGQWWSDQPLPQPAGTWTYLAEAHSVVMFAISLLLVIALAGTSLPFAWFLNRRFAGDPTPRPWTLLRQGLWVGVFAAVLFWLRVNDTFSVPLMLITAGALALVELLMLLRQRGAPA